MRKFSHALALAALLLSTSAYAQATAAPAASANKPTEQPWLYEGSDIPVDDTWTFGELPNGLRYAVKKNERNRDADSTRASSRNGFKGQCRCGLDREKRVRCKSFFSVHERLCCHRQSRRKTGSRI